MNSSRQWHELKYIFLSYWKRLNIKKLIFLEIKFINTMIIHLAFIMILLLNHQNIASCALGEPAGNIWRDGAGANAAADRIEIAVLFIFKWHLIPAQVSKNLPVKQHEL